VKPEDFIAAIAPAAREYNLKGGVFASLVIAQAALETGWGRYVPLDGITGKNSYNLFGIKGEGPAGSVTCRTWEVEDDRRIEVEARFRAYNSFAESMEDHYSVLLLSRYVPVREAGTPEDAAVQFYSCGYATDPNYPDKLVELIHQYDLKQYDLAIVTGPFPDIPYRHWAVEYVEACKEAGIMMGCEDGEFKGERSATRYELAAAMARVLKYINGREDFGGK